MQWLLVNSQRQSELAKAAVMFIEQSVLTSAQFHIHLRENALTFAHLCRTFIIRTDMALLIQAFTLRSTCTHTHTHTHMHIERERETEMGVLMTFFVSYIIETYDKQMLHSGDAEDE